MGRIINSSRKTVYRNDFALNDSAKKNARVRVFWLFAARHRFFNSLSFQPLETFFPRFGKPILCLLFSQSSRFVADVCVFFHSTMIAFLNPSEILRELSGHLRALKEQIKILHKRDYLSITPKLEDLALVNRWIQHFGVPHFYLQVFFDKAYVISFREILEISSDSSKEDVVFSVEQDVKNQGKTTIKINIQVIEKKHLFAILSITCEKDAFPDATTSVGIVLYDSAKSHHSVKFYNVATVDEITKTLRGNPTSEVATADLNPDSKWLPNFQENPVLFTQEHMIPLDYYGKFSRGIAKARGRP
jgi:hypothetical protein